MGQYFRFNGLLGLGLGGVLLLAINFYLIANGIMVQREESTTYYQIDRDINSLKANSVDNKKYYIVK